MLYKLLFGLLFACIYIFYYKGGDTVWYWDGASKMVNLFFKDPLLYLDIMASNPTWERYYNYFDSHTGYPPIWIYMEHDSFYVCKITSIFGFLTANSYLTMSMLFAFFAGHAAWKLYEVILQQKIASPRNAAFAMLFIPSVNFWASGIMKDTIVLCCTFYLISLVYKIFILKEKRLRIIRFFILLLVTYWIFKTRAFMLLCIIPCILVWVNFEILSEIKNKIIRVILIPIFLFALIISGVIIYFSVSSSFGSYSAENIVSTALVIQKDFQGNTTYSENKYNIGNVDGSTASMILVMPNAIMASLFRPYIWEANNILMLFSGLESLVFIFLTIRFLIRFRVYKWIPVFSKNKFLILCLTFIITLGYSVGFTSIIFGALVRFKAPIIPFFVLILLMDKLKQPTFQEVEMEDQELQPA